MKIKVTGVKEVVPGHGMGVNPKACGSTEFTHDGPSEMKALFGEGGLNSKGSFGFVWESSRPVGQYLSREVLTKTVTILEGNTDCPPNVGDTFEVSFGPTVVRV